MQTDKWPKILPPMTPEQSRISDAFMKLWHEELPRRFRVFPCEGSPAYSLARKISAERIYNRHFKGGYGWLISREHINRPHEILAELKPYFTVVSRTMFPLPFLPFVFNNLCVGLELQPRPRPVAR